MQGAEIAKMLVLSTAHLTEEACDQFLKLNPGSWFEKGDYGWFVYVDPDYHQTVWPGSLLACLDYAHDLGCQWIMFDRDGPVVDRLPVHDW